MRAGSSPTSRAIAACALVVGFASLACDPPPPAMCAVGPNKPFPDTRAFVVNGTESPVFVPLDDQQLMAIVGISRQSAGSFCSGTLISDSVVLTATHCTRGIDGDRFRVLFGARDADPDAVIDVVEKHEHPTRDLALLVLAEPASSVVDVRPLPIDDHPLLPSEIGMPLEQAGFGLTETDQKQGRRFAKERFDGFEGPFLVVDGGGERGVCSGDSGGPSMRVNQMGETRVVGTLSWGDGSCVDRDRYTRTDLVRAFIEGIAGATPVSAPVACDDVDRAGWCTGDRSIARRCEADLRVVDVCDARSRCVATEGDARCVPIDERACGQETAFGRCEGERLIWCDEAEGTLYARDCRGCDETCALIDSVLGYACIPSSCEGIDQKGVCEDETAVWCAQGELFARDCEAEGLTCGLVDDEAGVSCGVDGACGDIDYLGTCQGDTVVWCSEGGVLADRDCAASGQTCAFVDDTTGYYCVD